MTACYLDRAIRLVRDAGGAAVDDPPRLAVFAAKPVKFGSRLYAYLRDRAGDIWLAKVAVPDDPLLEREYEALSKLATALTSRMAGTIPAKVAFEAPILVQELRKGRSLYQELSSRHRDQAAMKGLRRNARICIDWLVDFHESTAHTVQGSTLLGWVHGDFKPSNVLLANEGEITVIDWELFAERGNQWADLFHFITYLALTGATADRLAAFREAFEGSGFKNDLIRELLMRYVTARRLGPGELQNRHIDYLDFVLERRRSLGLSNEGYFAESIRDYLSKRSEPLSLYRKLMP